VWVGVLFCACVCACVCTCVCACVCTCVCVCGVWVIVCFLIAIHHLLKEVEKSKGLLNLRDKSMGGGQIWRLVSSSGLGWVCLTLYLGGMAELDGAKTLLQQYRAGQEPSGTTEEQLWRAKVLYDSAFHPQTGEKNFLLGRMSCQVPANMLITGAMMTWYKSNTAAIILQVVNQTFNATANYTNRNASSHITNDMLAQAYILATLCSVSVAVGLNKLIARSATLSKGMIGRCVPLTHTQTQRNAHTHTYTHTHTHARACARMRSHTQTFFALVYIWNRMQHTVTLKHTVT